GGRVDNGVDLPRRVDHHALARDGVAHEVDEVLHGAQLELLEVEAIVPGLHDGSCYRTPVDYARTGPLNDRSFDEPTSSVTRAPRSRGRRGTALPGDRLAGLIQDEEGVADGAQLFVDGVTGAALAAAPLR